MLGKAPRKPKRKIIEDETDRPLLNGNLTLSKSINYNATYVQHFYDMCCLNNS